jgi:hypothetical protein
MGRIGVQIFHRDMPDDALVVSRTYNVYSDGTVETSIYYFVPMIDATGKTFHSYRFLCYLSTKQELEEYNQIKDLPYDELAKWNRSIHRYSCSVAKTKDGKVTETICDGCKRTFRVDQAHTCPAENKVPEELWVYWNWFGFPGLCYRHPWIKRLQYTFDWIVSKIVPGRKQHWMAVWDHGEVYFVKRV